MKTKEKIIEVLEGERIKQVWELIVKAVQEIYGQNRKIPKRTKKEYFSFKGIINSKRLRYLIIEHYSLDDGFYFQYHGDDVSTLKMFEDYFNSEEMGWEKILLVDMKEMKCYLIDKKVSYSKKEVEI